MVEQVVDCDESISASTLSCSTNCMMATAVMLLLTEAMKKTDWGVMGVSVPTSAMPKPLLYAT